MPTYDYVCDACEHQFEHRQSMSSDRLRTCPQCKKRKLRRLIGSGAGVIFRGSGFYETDYKKRGGSATKSTSERTPASPGECTSDPASCSGPCGTAKKDD